MNKLALLKKVLEIVQESFNASKNTPDKNYDQTESKVANFDHVTDLYEIEELSKNFAKALNDRNFEHLDGRAEYHFYTMDHLIELIKNNDEQNTIKIFNDYKIESKYENCEFVSITMGDDQEEAEVICNVWTSIISANANYFKELSKKNNKENPISAGTPFSTEYTLVVKKEKGTWKVDKFKAVNH